MPEVILFIFLAFVVLVLLRVPIAVALFIPPIIYIIIFDIPFFLITQQATRGLYSFSILTVPLFILVGSLMNNSGQTDKLFSFATVCVGHWRGGVAQVNIIASLLFSGISGSALADVGGVGKILIRSMKDEGYTNGYSAALTGASATVGPLFPPSIILVLYGVIAGAPVLDMLLAGIGPAILCVISLSVITAILARKNNMPRSSRAARKKIIRKLIAALPIIITPIILIGGMLTGLFGPSQIAAIAAIYIIAINFVVYRVTDLYYIWDSCKETMYTTVSVLFIVMAANLFAWVLAYESISQIVSDLFLISSNILILLLLLNIFLLILGLFLEPLTAMVISIPIFYPPFVEMGVDPVHLGVIIIFNLMIGLLTPPVGLTLYVVSDISNASVDSVISDLKPYYLALIVTLAIITFAPKISLWIPNTF